MTVANTTRKNGPYFSNGVQVNFGFTFKVFSAADVVVTHADANYAETVLVLNSDYVISLNGDQNANPGGTVTLFGAVPFGDWITLTSGVAYSQGMSLTNNGGFYPAALNDAADRAVMLCQQLLEIVNRCVQLPVSNASITPAQLLASISTNASAAAASASSASASASSASTSASTASGAATTALAAAASIGQLIPRIKVANYTALNGDFVDCTNAGLQITTPASPAAGYRFGVRCRVPGTTTIVRNGGAATPIMGDNSQDMTLGTAMMFVSFLYIDGTTGWALQ